MYIENTNCFEFKTSVYSKQYGEVDETVLVLGTIDAKHLARRYAERGGVNSAECCLNELSEALKNNKNAIEKLLAAHIEAEESHRAICLKFNDGKTYLLQYAGFVNYVEAFEVTTYFNDFYIEKQGKFHTNKNNIIVRA